MEGACSAPQKVSILLEGLTKLRWDSGSQLCHREGADECLNAVWSTIRSSSRGGRLSAERMCKCSRFLGNNHSRDLDGPWMHREQFPFYIDTLLKLVSLSILQLNRGGKVKIFRDCGLLKQSYASWCLWLIWHKNAHPLFIYFTSNMKLVY